MVETLPGVARRVRKTTVTPALKAAWIARYPPMSTAIVVGWAVAERAGGPGRALVTSPAGVPEPDQAGQVGQRFHLLRPAVNPECGRRTE
jgi:hypothetical protein